MAKKTYIIKDKGKGQLDTVDPNSLVSISEQTASSSTGGGGGTEIPDWQSQSYSQGDIVSHNGGIWRSEVEGNTDEPMECEVSSWEEVPTFTVDKIWMPLEEELPFPFDFSNQILYEGASIERFSMNNTSELGVSGDVGDIIYFFIELPMFIELADTVLPSDGTDEINNKIASVLGTGFPYDVITNLGMPCDDLLSITEMIGKFLTSTETTVYELASCPDTDFPPAETSCSWTLLADISEVDFIPLSGTEENKPVTGSIELRKAGVEIYSNPDALFENPAFFRNLEINIAGAQMNGVSKYYVHPFLTGTIAEFTNPSDTTIHHSTMAHSIEGTLISRIISDEDDNTISGIKFTMTEMSTLPAASLIEVENNVESPFMATEPAHIITKQYFDDNSSAGGGGELVQITEGGNTGWGLKYRVDNPNYYGDIGNNAIDLSFSGSNSTTRGATGSYSFSVGNNSVVSKDSNISLGNLNNLLNGLNSIVIGSSNTINASNKNQVFGCDNSITFGQSSYIFGQNNIIDKGSSYILGSGNTSTSYRSISLGFFNTIKTQSADSWVLTDDLFTVGNGQNAATRSNAFTILKNGLATLPSVTNTLIDTEPTGKAVLTREWYEANAGGDFIPLSGTEAEKPLTGSIEAIGTEVGFGVIGNLSDGGSIYINSLSEGASLEISSDQSDYISFFHENAVGFEGEEGAEVIRIPYKSGIMLLNDSISYSTTEIKTGGTWIDGKPIYRRVIEITQPGGYQDFGNIIIDSEEVELISVAGTAKYQRAPLDALVTYFINSSMPYYAEDSTTIECFFNASAETGAPGTSVIIYYYGLTDEGVFPSNIPFKIILEYTK